MKYHIGFGQSSAFEGWGAFLFVTHDPSGVSARWAIVRCDVRERGRNFASALCSTAHAHPSKRQQPLSGGPKKPHTP